MSDYDDILVSIRRITRAIDLHSKRLVKSSGLTAPQLIILQTLAKEGRMAPSAIARQVALSQATITSIMDRLDKAGLITRDKSHRDKRIVWATITDEGMARLKAAPELLQSGFLREFRKIEEWERRMLVSSLQRVASMMDAEDLDASPILDVGDLQRHD